MRILKLAIVGLGVFFGTAVFAQEEKAKLSKEERTEKQMEKLAEKLDLTDQQKVQVEALHKEKKAAHKKLKEDSTLDEAEKKAAMKELRADQKTKMAEILTDEQELKLKEMKKERAENKKKKGKKHGGKKKGEKKEQKNIAPEKL